MAEFQYRIKAKYAHKEQLITRLNGESINLSGRDVTVNRAASKERPAYQETIRGATENDLKALYEAGSNLLHIEKVPVFNDPAPAISNENSDDAGEKAPAGENKASAAKAAKAQ